MRGFKTLYETLYQSAALHTTIGVLKHFAEFTGKHLCWTLFFKEVVGLLK